MWQRRAFLKAAGAGLIATLTPRTTEALERSTLLFATATQEAPGQYGARVLTDRGDTLLEVALPIRGHDVSYSADAGRAVVFARRPGTMAVVFDPAGQAAAQILTTPEDRHFFGHGAFSADGRLLYATENDFAAGTGKIGIYDVAGGYRRIGEYDTYGVGPHEMLLMPDGKSFVIANGGIETHPDYGRAELNLETMDPSLCFVDARDGHLIGQLRLDAGLHRLSIRHLAVDAAGRVWFGCQFRGQGEVPDVVGFATADGDIRLIDLGADERGRLAGYVGGLAMSRDGETLAVSSPVGGSVLCLDTRTQAVVDRLDLPVTCGVAPDAQGFLATNGKGMLAGLGDAADLRRQFPMQFDEHLRPLV